jgi:hypothetical protein
VTCFLRSPGHRRHENLLQVEVSLRDSSEDATASQEVTLGFDEQRAVSLPFRQPARSWVGLRIAVEFGHYVKGTHAPSMQMPYLLAYHGNELIDLFNSSGSDKGTQVAFGGAVPHCYAVDYHHLLEPLRPETFSLLEIGLDNESKRTGRASRAPSLEVWRRFFPHAELYGLDINDFSMFRQAQTITYRGDQSSREDLHDFCTVHRPNDLRLILDDGSHASSHQQISLATLFPYLEPGGIYIIEDLHWQPIEEVPRTIDLLTTFIQTGRFASPFLTAAECRYLEQHLAECRIYKPNDAEFAVLRKAG